MSDIAAVVSSLRGKGVRLWSSAGRLHYQSAGEALTAADLETLRKRKPEIIQFLERFTPNKGNDIPLTSRPRPERVSLTVLQRLTWNWRRLSGVMSHNTRSVANAMRLSGTLNIECLKGAFAVLVQRHEVLRSRIVVMNDEVSQVVIDDMALELEIIDLGGVPADGREMRIQQAVEEFVKQPCDVTVGPLFGMRLVRCGDSDYVLMVSIDHIIGDATSMGIILRELWVTYLRASLQLPFAPRPRPLQFADYALWERETEASWTEKHGTYWKERLVGATRTRLLTGDGSKDSGRLRTIQVPVEFGPAVAARLQDWSRRGRTTLAMTVLSTYIALVSRWTGSRDITIGFLTAGRHRPEIENTIGLFAFVLYLRVHVLENDSFSQLLCRVTREYYTAYEHQDFGRMTLPLQTAEYTKTSHFNWRMRPHISSPVTDFHDYGSKRANAGLKLRPFPVKKALFDSEWDEHLAAFDNEPALMLSESATGVSGGLWYREDRAAASTMQRFVRSLHLFANELAKNSQDDVAVSRLPCER